MNLKQKNILQENKPLPGGDGKTIITPAACVFHIDQKSFKDDNSLQEKCIDLLRKYLIQRVQVPMLVDIMLPKMPVTPGQKTDSKSGWKNKQNMNKLTIDLGGKDHAE